MAVLFQEGRLWAAVWAEPEPPALAHVSGVVLFGGVGVVQEIRSGGVELGVRITLTGEKEERVHTLREIYQVLQETLETFLSSASEVGKLEVKEREWDSREKNLNHELVLKSKDELLLP